ncbi:MAG: LysR family transcriptional regulator [Hyphomicrobiales bacterium]|nr:MAG: LysR family transcriptional regulator [Hyphomicrobiales bacterium]
MRELNLNGIDLNLLPPLEALLRLRHVTRAAEEVGLSQPAMSRALGRLRALLGDPLLVKGASGLVPTPRALALVPLVAAALSHTKTVFRHWDFDPSVAKHVVRMAGSDAQSILLAPGIAAVLAREAPSVTLRIVPIALDLVQRMEDGTVDFGFALATTPLPAGARSLPLENDRLVVVMRRGHPAARRPWRLADYARFDTATVAILGDGHSEMDAILAEAGITRRIGFTSPHFTAALAMVAGTDMVTTISEKFARRFASAFDLVIKPAPFAASALPVVLVWSQLRDHDPLHMWLRRTIQNAVATAEMAPLRPPASSGTRPGRGGTGPRRSAAGSKTVRRSR